MESDFGRLCLPFHTENPLQQGKSSLRFIIYYRIAILDLSKTNVVGNNGRFFVETPHFSYPNLRRGYAKFPGYNSVCFLPLKKSCHSNHTNTHLSRDGKQLA